MAALVTEGGGHHVFRQDDKQLTLDSLVAWYLEFAREDRGLDHSTLTGYADAYSHWLKKPIGQKRANSITTAELDTAFDRMPRAGLSRSTMNNAGALLSGAFQWGKRHRKVISNPVMASTSAAIHPPRHTTAPELNELLRLLATADEHDKCSHRFSSSPRPTGLRRGELSGLRRDRLHLDRHEFIVDTAINDAGGTVVEKQTKTSTAEQSTSTRPPSSYFEGHLAEMDARGSHLWTQRCPGWFRVQPRSHLQHSPAPRTAHPTNAPTA